MITTIISKAALHMWYLFAASFHTNVHFPPRLCLLIVNLNLAVHPHCPTLFPVISLTFLVINTCSFILCTFLPSIRLLPRPLHHSFIYSFRLRILFLLRHKSSKISHNLYWICIPTFIFTLSTNELLMRRVGWTLIIYLGGHEFFTGKLLDVSRSVYFHLYFVQVSLQN